MLSRDVTLRLLGVAYIAAVVFWFTLEGRTARSHWPRYSFAANMISELGVPYMYFGGVHYLDYSPLAWLMNVNFFGTAGLYALAQWVLLYVTQGDGQVDRRLRLARAVLSALFLVGLTMVGVIHGGPREHENGTIIEHEVGATFAILGGNFCSILAGASPTQIKPVATGNAYRIACLVLGILGTAFVIALVTITPQSLAGAVERLSVYTIFAWELLTGVLLLVIPLTAAKAKTV